MLGTFLINTALALGQPVAGNGMPPVVTPMPATAPAEKKDEKNGEKNGNGDKKDEEKKEEEKKEEEAPKYLFMRALEGTKFAEEGFYITGWLAGSYNFSSAAQNNLPLAWTDRANEPMFQQGWVRFGKAIDTKKDEVQFGFLADVLYGSDYRFTLPRGLFNSQERSADGEQNIYGVDPIQHYVSMYIPKFLGEGTEFRAGRLTPLITRSYAFNSAPPFTHCGVGMYTTFSKEWSGTFMVVNGNDIYFGGAGQQWRGVGALKWTSPDEGRDTITVAASVGRGAFDPGHPYASSTFALANEPFGRNNFNAFDLVWTHKIDDTWSTAVEMIYGYQTNVVPAAAPGLGGPGAGTCHWASAAGYVFYNLSEQVTLTTRLEGFDDFQGQRTGFEGLYLSATAGVAYKPVPDVIFRTEARYDHNVETRPFEGDPGIFVLAAELIFRF
jgi:hypothetical protein